MPAVQFDRDATARWYAEQHMKVDPGIKAIYYLPLDAPEREIRLLEVNELLVSRDVSDLEPIEFGVDRGQSSEHQLLILDVTPAQWEGIRQQELALPADWSLQQAVNLHTPCHE